MSFLDKPNSPEQIKAALVREQQAKILQDFDQYGEQYFFQRCHINAYHDLNDAMFATKRIDQRSYNLRKGAIDKLASMCFKQFCAVLEANHMLYQLRLITAQIQEQIGEQDAAK